MKIKLRTISEYILVLLLILQCNSMYSRVAGGVQWLYLIIPMMMIQSLLLIQELPLTKRVLNSLLVFLVIYYVIQFMTLVLSASSNFNREFIISNLVLLPLSIVMGTLQIYTGELESILSKMNHTISVLAVISLFFWLFGSVLHVVSPTGSIENQWADGAQVLHYYRLHFETQRITLFDFVLTRNTGIFVEGPMWNLVLSLGFITELFILRKANHFRVVLFAITIATIFSTTGIYVLGLSILAYYLMQGKLRNKLTLALISVPVIYTLSQVLGGKSATESGTIRIDDYYAGIRAWSERWLFGWGENSLERIQYHMNTGIRPNLGYSNSLFVILAKGGVLQGLTQLVPILGIIIFPKVLPRIRIAAGMLLLLVATVIFENTAIYCLAIGLCYGLMINSVKIN